jgi:hypothetical protein
MKVDRPGQSGQDSPVAAPQCGLQSGRWTLCRLPCLHVSALIADGQPVLTPFGRVTRCEQTKGASRA